MKSKARTFLFGIAVFTSALLFPGADASATTVAGSGTAPTVTATPIDQGIIIQWEEVANAQRYRYRYRREAESWSTTMQVPIEDSREASILGLETGVEYTVAVGTRVGGRWRNDWTSITIVPKEPPPPENQPPTLDLEENHYFTLNQAITLSAEVADDGLPEAPGAVSMAWTQTAGLEATIGSPAASSTLITVPEVGVYTFELTADDGEFQVLATTTLTVDPIPPNTPPTLTSEDVTVIVGEVATLEVVVEDDGLPLDPGVVTVGWTQVSGPGTLTIDTPAAPSMTAMFDTEGSYVFELAVTDGELSATAQVTVEVIAKPFIYVSDLPVADFVEEIGLEGSPVDTSSFSKPCVADMDEDGIRDSIWSIHKRGAINFYRGAADGTFNQLTGLGLSKHDNHGCVIEDFDKDGDLDIFSPAGACQGNCFKRDRLWLQRDKNFSFAVKDWKLGKRTKDRSRDSVSADFNNDTWPDLLISASAASNGNHSNHRVILNRGTFSNGNWAGFSTPVAGVGDSRGNASCAHAADLDGDGWIDAMVCNNKDGHVDDGLMIYKNEMGASFSPYPVSFDTTKARGVTTADMNGDALPDLLIAFTDRFELRLNQGAGVFDSVNLTVPLLFGHEVVTPDFDGDGDLDILIVQALSSQAPDSDGAHMLFLNRDGDATGWDKNLVPQPVGGAGDKAVVYTDFMGSGADAVFIGNGGQWDTKGPRQVLALDNSQVDP